MQNKLLILCCLLGLFSCKNDCPEGYEPFEDTCICPEDKFEGLGMCRNLEEGEYYGTIDCIFQDTVFVKFLDKEEDHINIEFDRNDERRISVIGYITLPTYDSLYYSEYWGSGFLGQRTIDGKFHAAQIYGRLTDESFIGRLEWRNANSGELTESCPFEMVTK